VGPLSQPGAIILLTARGEESDRIIGLELGPMTTWSSPFSPRELTERVKAVLRPHDGAPHHGSSRLEVGGLVIDAETREVTREGRELALTATEFDLLWCLASHPRVVFSREQLLATVWGYEAASMPAPAPVTVHVRRVREKIEEDASHPKCITTVWGVGYGSSRDHNALLSGVSPFLSACWPRSDCGPCLVRLQLAGLALVAVTLPSPPSCSRVGHAPHGR